MTKYEIEEVEGGYIVEWDSSTDCGKMVVMEGKLGEWFDREIEAETCSGNRHKISVTLGVCEIR